MKLEILGLSEVRWPNFGEHGWRRVKFCYTLAYEVNTLLATMELVSCFHDPMLRTNRCCRSARQSELLQSTECCQHVMGHHGLEELSENGELFAEFCGNNDWRSLFPHRPVHKVTWVSGDGVTENQIDHIDADLHQPKMETEPS